MSKAAGRSFAATLAGVLFLAVLPAQLVRDASAAVTPGGTFHALTPARILDTRIGTGGVSAPLGPGATLNVLVGGQGGVPSASVSAVVLNVTATDPTATSFLTLFPAGVTTPVTSNLNWGQGQTVAKVVTVGLGAATGTGWLSTV